MASSGEFLFLPQLADAYDEAFERAKIDPSSITGKHIRSAQRSVNYMLVEWGNEIIQWVFNQETIPMVQGTSTYVLPAKANDIVTSVIRRSGADTPMIIIARATFLDIPDKTNQGLPIQYKVDRKKDAVEITVWPIPENSTDVIVYDYMRRIEDAGEMQDTPDIPYRFLEAFVSGLAARLALKYSPRQVASDLSILAERAFKKASDNDDEPASIMIIPTNNRGPGYHGRGR